MNERQTQFDWRFGTLWLLSCAAGSAVLIGVAYRIMSRVGEATAQRSAELSAVNGDPLQIFLAGAILGAFTALGGTLGPGLLLRRVGISAWNWVGYSVAATAAVMSGGMLLLPAIIPSIPFAAASAVLAVFAGLALGVPMGLVQWRLLEQRQIRAAIWPLVTFTAYLFGFGLTVLLRSEGREWVGLGGTGLLVGTITALGVVWLTRRDAAASV